MTVLASNTEPESRKAEPVWDEGTYRVLDNKVSWHKVYLVTLFISKSERTLFVKCLAFTISLPEFNPLSAVLSLQLYDLI